MKENRSSLAICTYDTYLSRAHAMTHTASDLQFSARPPKYSRGPLCGVSWPVNGHPCHTDIPRALPARRLPSYPCPRLPRGRFG